MQMQIVNDQGLDYVTPVPSAISEAEYISGPTEDVLTIILAMIALATTLLWVLG